MTLQTSIKRNAYYDSVTLMLLTRELQKLEGVELAGGYGHRPQPWSGKGLGLATDGSTL